MTATITHYDNESGIDIEKSRWVYNTISTEIGIEEEKYTDGGFTENEQVIDLILNQVGVYYLHILSVDNFGNKKETIKGPIEITENYHEHIGDTLSGGECYEEEIYHDHTSECYGMTTCVLTLVNSYENRFGGASGKCPYCASTNTQTHYYYVYSHSACGSGNTTYETWTCYGMCGKKVTSGTNSNHSTSALICEKTTSSIDGYLLTCVKTEDTIDSYCINY